MLLYGYAAMATHDPVWCLHTAAEAEHQYTVSVVLLAGSILFLWCYWDRQ
jgi:hypothetical protein